MKFAVPPPLHQPIIQLTEKNNLTKISKYNATKTTLKVPVPDSSQIHDKFIPVPDYIIPITRSRDDSNSRMVKRKTIQDISWDIPTYSDPIYRPPPEPIEMPLQEIPRKLMDLDMDFKENSHFKNVLYQKHIKNLIGHISKNHQNWIF